MNPLLKLLPRPSRERFVRQVTAALVREGVPEASIVHDPAHFEVRVGDSVFYLGNAYRAACLEWPWNRHRVIRSLLSLRRRNEEPRPQDLDAVRANLLPGVRHVFAFESTELTARLRGQEFPVPPGFACGPWLRVVLVVDAPDTTAIVAQRDLDQWGVSFDEAYAIALENLRVRSRAPLGRAADGVYHSTWSDCYDPSRLLLPETLAALDLDGPPVVAMPSWHHLLVTGGNHHDGIEAMIRFGLKVGEEEPKTLSALPLVRREGEWVELELPRGHALEPLLRQARVVELTGLYGEQKTLLDGVNEQQGADLFVATHSAYKLPANGGYVSRCTWSQGVRTLLPRTEEVWFFDDRLPADAKVCAQVDWDIVQMHCAALMSPGAQALPRWEVDAFPDPGQLDRMRAAQALRTPTR